MSSFYIILFSEISIAKTGSPYATIVCRDLNETITVNVWGTPLTSPFKPGQLIRFDNLKSDSGFLSCSFPFVTLSHPSPDDPLLQFIPKAVSKDEWLSLAQSLVSLCSPKEAEFILSQFTLLYQPYSTHTAARSNHHNFIGGLLQHTYELLNLFNSIYPVLPFHVSPFIVIVSCLYHDFGKLSEYTESFDYLPAFFLQGHPFLGAESVGAVLRANNFPENVVQHCQHCVLAHHGRKEWGSPVIPASPEAYIVSVLDAISGTGVQYDKPTGTKSMGTTIYRFE